MTDGMAGAILVGMIPGGIAGTIPGTMTDGMVTTVGMILGGQVAGMLVDTIVTIMDAQAILEPSITMVVLTPPIHITEDRLQAMLSVWVV